MDHNLMKDLTGPEGWKVSSYIDSAIQSHVDALLVKPRGFLHHQFIQSWAEAATLMRGDRLKDAWALARDCMVELANVLCAREEISPDELTEWEKSPTKRKGKKK